MPRINVTLTLNLPQELLDEAKSAGLLTAEQIERWITDELDRKRKLDRFFGKLERLAKVEPPITTDEINAEIETYRREKRQRNLDHAE
ncbi:MAG: hypothetical protein IT328_19410 [Caldilineaceae bacterium]|nr:hypothetical protein [Caldilineaceae bacterium]